MKPVLVGRDPGRGWHPDDLPIVNSPTGERLARWCGLNGSQDLLDHFLLTNIFTVPTDEYDPVLAASKREWIERNYVKQDRMVVLLGRDAQQAFNWGGAPYFTPLRRVTDDRRGEPVSYLVAGMPHPSGRARFWNDEDNVRRAKLFLRSLIRSS